MNALPVSAVERVEILKDGASLVVRVLTQFAGVINIITKAWRREEHHVTASQPFDSGGETFRVTELGAQLCDRGSLSCSC